MAVGHPLNYLPSAEAIERAIGAMADALRPGGILAFDLCDLAYGALRAGQARAGWAGDDWALVTEFSARAPDRFVRQMAIFTKVADGTWRREDERHENVLVETARVPAFLAARGVVASVRAAFGAETLPDGLVAVVGTKGSGDQGPHLELDGGQTSASRTARTRARRALAAYGLPRSGIPGSRTRLSTAPPSA